MPELEFLNADLELVSKKELRLLFEARSAFLKTRKGAVFAKAKPQTRR
jgi:hypothetical protein